MYEDLAVFYILISFCFGMFSVGIIILIMEWIERRKNDAGRKRKEHKSSDQRKRT